MARVQELSFGRDPLSKFGQPGTSAFDPMRSFEKLPQIAGRSGCGQRWPNPVSDILRSVRRQRAVVICDGCQRHRRPYRRVARLKCPERWRYRVSAVGSSPARLRSRRVRRKFVGLRLNRCCFSGQFIKYGKDPGQIFSIRSYVVGRDYVSLFDVQGLFANEFPALTPVPPHLLRIKTSWKFSLGRKIAPFISTRKD